MTRVKIALAMLRGYLYILSRGRFRTERLVVERYRGRIYGIVAAMRRHPGWSLYYTRCFYVGPFPP